MSVPCAKCGHKQANASSQNCEACGTSLADSTGAAVTATPPSTPVPGSTTAIAEEDVAARMTAPKGAADDMSTPSIRRRDRSESRGGISTGWIVLLVLLVVGLPLVLMIGCTGLGGMVFLFGAREAHLMEERAMVAMKAEADAAEEMPMDMAVEVKPPKFNNELLQPDGQPLLVDRARLDDFVNQNLKATPPAGALAPGGKAWNVLKAVGDAKRLQENAVVGGAAGKATFRDVAPDNGLLIGFFAGTDGEFLQPIYMTPTGEKAGKRYGDPKGSVRCIKAQSGYAIGAIDVRSSDVLHSLIVTFMRVTDDGLDAKDSYQPPRIGKDGGVQSRVGGDGRFIVGIHGKMLHDGDIQPVGTITALGVISLR